MKEKENNIRGGIWFLSILLGTVVGLWTDFKTGFTAFVALLVGLTLYFSKLK